MPALTLVTDSSADLPPELQEELGIIVVPGRCAFDEHSFADGELSSAEFYGRMRHERRPPRPFGAPEEAFRVAFEAALARSPQLVCLVMPFDVVPSFTTASAAMLSMDGVDIKILNPGVASAGLCSLIVSLSAGVNAGWDRDALLAAVDELEPLCDALFVPNELEWLERTGRLPLIEDRIGQVGAGLPVVRVGTRITGVAREVTRERALKKAVETVGARAGERSLIVTIDHANAPDVAGQLAEMARRRWNVARLIVTDLSPTIGSQLGPGAIGVGVAPVARL